MPEPQMVSIGDYCHVLKGKIGIKKAIPGQYPLVTTAEERSSHIEYHFDKPSVIIPLVSSTGHGHASLKRIHFQEGKFAVGSILCAVTPKNANILDARFLYHYLDVYKENLLVSLMQGMANVTLSIDKIKEIQFPLLPIEKQAEWIHLFEKAVSFTNGLSAEFTCQQTLLKKFRQSILQDAISGKLTEQWRKENPDVEPASELLKRIKTEKERLVKEKKIPKQNPLPPITEEEIPFELPEGWVWCRLGEVCLKLSTGPFGSMLHKSDYVEDGIPLVNPINMISNKIYPNNKMMVNEKTKARLKQFVLTVGDIVIARRGDLSKCAIVSEKQAGWLCGTGSFFISISKYISQPFFVYFFISSYCQAMLNDNSVGSTMNNLNQKVLQNILFPFAPVKEQKNIIEIIDRTYNICDQLETQITKSRQDSEMLMQAVLKEAFEG